jgi:hypothetical protein
MQRRATRRAARLGVTVGHHGAAVRNSVDIGSLAAHHAAVIRADVEPTDIVGDDEQNVGFGLRRAGGVRH